jgi:hypothetical protein
VMMMMMTEWYFSHFVRTDKRTDTASLVDAQRDADVPKM